MSNKNMLKMENQNLKEMQKLLMNRLEQQDEYFNQCMYGKQQEIDQMIVAYSDMQTENVDLRNKLTQTELELRRCQKLLQYYPKNVQDNNSKLSLQTKLEEKLKQCQGYSNADIDISVVQKEVTNENCLDSKQEKFRNLKIPGLNNGSMNNCGNTYLDLNLTVNNINSNSAHGQIQSNDSNIQTSPALINTLYRFIIDEEMIEEDSERMDDNLRQKMRAQALSKLDSTNTLWNQNISDKSKKVEKIDETFVEIDQFSQKRKSSPSISMNLNGNITNDTSVAGTDYPTMNLNSFRKHKQNNSNNYESRVLSSSASPQRGKCVKIDNKTDFSNEFDNEQNTKQDLTSVDQDSSNQTIKQIGKANNIYNKEISQEKNIFGINPEMIEILKKFNEMPIEQLRKELYNMENSN